jgi:hypothetical protein
MACYSKGYKGGVLLGIPVLLITHTLRHYLDFRYREHVIIRHTSRVLLNTLSLKNNVPCRLVNKANFVHNIFLLYLWIPTRFGRIYAHHHEKQLCSCDTWYLLFCVDDCLVRRVAWNSIHSTLHTRQPTIQNNKYQMSHEHSFLSWWRAYSHPKHVEIDKYTKNKYTKNKLWTKLVLFTRLYKDARKTEHKIIPCRVSYRTFGADSSLQDTKFLKIFPTFLEYVFTNSGYWLHSEPVESNRQ